MRPLHTGEAVGSIPTLRTTFFDSESPMADPALYILVDTSHESLTRPGKCGAQTAHAASDFAGVMEADLERGGGGSFDGRVYSTYDQWRGDRRFGTTIILDAMEAVVRANEGNRNRRSPAIPKKLWHEDARATAERMLLPHGLIVDDSFPIDDGLQRFYVRAETCFWVFVPDRTERIPALRLPLL